MIDVDTGEVLAMVNQPSYNPNDRDQLKPGLYRNRAATDIFEPGSSVKPFIMAAALASGQYRPDSVVDTSPGFFKVGNKVEEDEHNFGVIDLATILAKSSNVGTAKIALSLQPEQIWSTFTGLGLGQVTGSNFPGESAGMLSNYAHWRPDRHRHAVAWLRAVGDAAAVGACLRHHRRRRDRAARSPSRAITAPVAGEQRHGSQGRA